jgi:N-acetylmuramoyl-L-alanine amidase
MNKPEYIIVHHTGGTVSDPKADTSHHTFEQVNAWHRQDPNVWLGYLSSLGYSLGYHYFIDKSGKVKQARAHTDIGAHCKGYNNKSIGICLAGNFDVTIPTKEQTEALRKLLLILNDQYPKTEVVPHRHFSSKSCYGSKLADSWAVDLIKKTPIPAPCQAEKDEIVELKKTIGFYDTLISWFFPKA